MVTVTERVNQFYRQLPFNYEQTIDDTCRTIRDSNQIAMAYPPLDAVLKSAGRRVILDVGCGAGWFVNTAAYHYGVDAVGVDLCEPAIQRGRAVSERLSLERTVRYHVADLFQMHTIALTPTNQFFLVNSLGVLHHTVDCRQALARVAERVEAEGFLHLGLYHRYGRQPFLDLFQPYRTRYKAASDEAHRQAIEQEALGVYRTLHASITNETMLRSWCRDQVFHPHESQHTLQEVYGWLRECGFRCVATSLNHFQPVPEWRVLFEEEKTLGALSYRRNYQEKRYFPGFFIILAQKHSDASTAGDSRA